MGVRFQRHLGARPALQPGQFMSDPMTPTPGVMCTAHVCCPTCGAIHTLTAAHKIGAAGLVAPAWKCPTGNCPFFEFIELESWGDRSLLGEAR